MFKSALIVGYRNPIVIWEKKKIYLVAKKGPLPWSVLILIGHKKLNT